METRTQQSKPTPYLDEFQQAILASGENIAALLQKYESEPPTRRVQKITQDYRSDIPLLIALATIVTPRKYTLQSLLALHDPVAAESLEEAGFQKGDMIAYDRHDKFFWGMTAESLKTSRQSNNMITTDDFGILLSDRVMDTVAQMPRDNNFIVYGRPQTLEGKEADLAALASKITDSERLIDRIEPMVQQRRLRLEMTPFHLDQPHFGIINDSVFLRQRTVEQGKSSNIVLQIEKPIDALLSYLQDYRKSLRMASAPVFPILEIPGSTIGAGELHESFAWL